MYEVFKSNTSLKAHVYSIFFKHKLSALMLFFDIIIMAKKKRKYTKPMGTKGITSQDKILERIESEREEFVVHAYYSRGHYYYLVN